MEKYVSERDFVAQFLLNSFKGASDKIGVRDHIDFSIEKKINSGFADLVLERASAPVLVLEAKFKKKIGQTIRDIEPRDPDVIKQAVSYAVLGGYPYYATCNTKRIILFKLQPGVKLFESEIASYEYQKDSNWAEEILSYTLGLKTAEPKQIDDTLVNILHEAYNDLFPEFLKSLREKLQEDDFVSKFIEWIESQGLKLSDDSVRLIASQATYMEINKLLFYHIIRIIYPEILSPLIIQDYEDVSRSLNKFYIEVLKIDYSPIYDKTIISEIYFTVRAEERVRTLLNTLNLFDFSEIEGDFIGAIYEKLIPPLERKRLGQFYTPLGIVDLIIKLTIKNDKDVIVDPGCGSGTFLVRSFHHIKDMRNITLNKRDIGSIIHYKKILEQIYGIDINQFPAHLSVINLAIQNPYAKIDRINVIVEDFFNIKPGISTLTGFHTFTTKGEKEKVELPPFFDTVIGNPPYIRQELLSVTEKQKIKKLIENEYLNEVTIGSSNKKDIIKINKQSDIYIYFFMHGLKLLRNKGRLGFITSNKWLEVSYGIQFQKWLLNNVKVLYIIEFDRAIFPDAEVNAAITVLEKENNETLRKNNNIKFIRFKKKIDINKMVNLIKNNNKYYEDDKVKINIVKQKDISPGKWNLYLRSPLTINKILSKDIMINFIEKANIFRGVVTGNNDFFIISKEKAKDYKIEQKYLKPCIASPKEINGLKITNKDITKYIINVDKHKHQLKNTNILKYIEHGEKIQIDVTRGSQNKQQFLPEVSTLKARKLWYNIKLKPEAEILFQYLIDKNAKAFWNQAGAHSPNIIHYVNSYDKNEILPLLGYLNSSLNSLMIELYGRSYGGGVLKIEVYELKSLPIINISKLTNKQKISLEEAFIELSKSHDNKENNFEGITQSQKKLDNVVFDILELNANEREEILNGLLNLQQIRRSRTKV